MISPISAPKLERLEETSRNNVAVIAEIKTKPYIKQKMKESVQINAILEEEVEKILRKTAYYEDFLAGKLLCSSCGSTITLKNIGIIVPTNKDNSVTLEFVCDDVYCNEEYKRK